MYQPSSTRMLADGLLQAGLTALVPALLISVAVIGSGTPMPLPLLVLGGVSIVALLAGLLLQRMAGRAERL